MWHNGGGDIRSSCDGISVPYWMIRTFRQRLPESTIVPQTENTRRIDSNKWHRPLSCGGLHIFQQVHGFLAQKRGGGVGGRKILFVL